MAFPILLANLTGELLGGSAAPTDAVAPGDPVTLVVPANATGVTITRPDGTTTSLVATAAGGSSLTYAATDLPGIYTVTPVLAPEASAGPSGSGAGAGVVASPAGTATAPGASAGASGHPIDAAAPVRFAVDLFDVGESTIAPGSAAAIEALGTAPVASPAPGGTDAPVERPTARDELWLPIVLIVLIGLCIEWAVYHRDALIRIRRSITARFGRQPSGGSA